MRRRSPAKKVHAPPQIVKDGSASVTDGAPYGTS
jgi:hypothetical protein